MVWFLRRKAPALKRVYLDYASTTPVDPRVSAAMAPYLSETFGNPSSQHEEGFAARDALAIFRRSIARTIEAHADEITFTGSGSEANNLAILGLARALERKGRKLSDMHAVASAIEHPSVLECLAKLRRRSLSVTLVRPTKEGIVTAEAIVKELTERTVLVSVGLVNGEIGTIAPLRKISQVLRARKGETIYLHTDASQAPLYLSLLVDSLGIDLMTVDAQKIYGPKGVGFLYHKRGVPLSPQTLGGSQESGLRAGTEPLSLIAGLATALRLAQEGWKERRESTMSLRDYLIEGLEARIPKAVLNGSRSKRVANNVNMSFPGMDGEYLAALLNAAGFAVATKSACLNRERVSYVIEALGADEARSSSAIRITLGIHVGHGELNAFLKSLATIVAKFDKSPQK